jgi:hypothetical protein
VFNDPDWWRTALPVGLCMLIPLVGPIVHLGWRRKMFHHIRAGGEGLLPLDFSEDLSQGVDPFIVYMTSVFAMMSVAFVLYLPGLFVGIVGGILEQEALVGFGMVLGFFGHLGLFPIMLIGNLLMVDFVRRGYHGERVPILAPRESFHRIKAHFVQYLLLLLTSFIGGILGGLGFYAACIGGFVTLPAGHAIGTHALAQWDKLSAP